MRLFKVRIPGTHKHKHKRHSFGLFAKEQLHQKSETEAETERREREHQWRDNRTATTYRGQIQCNMENIWIEWKRANRYHTFVFRYFNSQIHFVLLGSMLISRCVILSKVAVFFIICGDDNDDDDDDVRMRTYLKSIQILFELEM